jgi:cobalamin biosynthesis Mg chelatase CobN
MQTSIGVGNNEDLVIAEYTPKSRSETSFSDPKKLLGTLRAKVNTPMSSSKRELDHLSKLMEEDEVVKKEITEEIRATLPVEVVSGTVGEYLYSCLKSEMNGNTSACTPECVSFLPLSGKTKCDVPSYVRTSKGLTKLNESKGEIANVYTMGDSGDLKPEEEEFLRQEGITEVSVFKREPSSSRYVKSCSVSLPSHSDTRSRSSSSRRSVSFSDETQNYERKSSRPPEKPKKSSNNTLYFVVALIIILIIVGALWFFFFRSASSSSVEPSTSLSSKTSYKASTTPLIWED